MVRPAVAKRFVVRVRTNASDFAPVISFDTYEEAADAAPSTMAEYWEPTTAYTFVGSIWDMALAKGKGGKVADVFGRDFTVARS